MVVVLGVLLGFYGDFIFFLSSSPFSFSFPSVGGNPYPPGAFARRFFLFVTPGQGYMVYGGPALVEARLGSVCFRLEKDSPAH